MVRLLKCRNSIFRNFSFFRRVLCSFLVLHATLPKLFHNVTKEVVMNAGYSFAGKTMVVAGGTGDLGKEVVRLLVNKGVHVVLLGRSSAKALAEECTSKGTPMQWFAFDPANGVLPKFPDNFGVDGAFYCVGDSSAVYAGIGKSDPSSLEFVADRVLHEAGLQMFVDALLPHCTSGARFVVTGSEVSEMKQQKGMEQITYAAAKAAQRDLVRHLRETSSYKDDKGYFFDLYVLSVLATQKNSEAFLEISRRPGMSVVLGFLIRKLLPLAAIPPYSAAEAMVEGFGTMQHVTASVRAWWLPALKFPWLKK